MIAVECRAAVALVLDPRQTVTVRPRFDVGTPQAEQRAQHDGGVRPRFAGSHAAGAAQAAAAQQSIEDRFRLIVGMVGKCQDVGRLVRQRRQPRRPGGRFEPFAIGSHVDPANRARHAQARAQGGAEIRPVPGIGAETVIDMAGGQRDRAIAANAVQGVQQHHRVDAARERDADPPRFDAMPCETGPDRGRRISGARLP